MNQSEKILFRTVDEYITSLPNKSQARLDSLRKIIKEEAPEAIEVISYNMPAFKYKGILCYYAAHREHIGFYPASAEAIVAFRDELKSYRTSKGMIQFTLDKDIPEELIRKVIRYRLQEKMAQGKGPKK